MADALVSFLIKELVSVIKQEIEQEVRLVVGVEEEVKELKSTLETLQTVLKDAEHKQLMGKRKTRKWLNKLKIAAFEMEDVLDEWRTEIQRSQLETMAQAGDADGTRKEQVSSSLYSRITASKRTALRNDIASRIKDILETMDIIKTKSYDFKFITTKTSVEDSFTQDPVHSSPTINVEHDICGRDYDQQIILNELLGATKYQENEIISITGIAGIGKTTLAQLIFNHEKVRAHFQTHIWVSVSDPFDVVMVKKAIIREASINKPFDPQRWLALNTIPTDALALHALNTELVESIGDKKFLIVLDDVWTDDPDDWNHLKLFLADGAKGSRVLVTTQSESVASMAGPWEHQLNALSSHDSVSLLSRRAFRGAKKECEILKELSFEISLKCHGLPLALSLIGGYLNQKISEDHWRHILESEIWEFYVFHQQGLLNPAFLLSYDGLSAPLKNCFAYCALFQKDHKIAKHSLIRLWMAQGFLNSTNNETKEPELVGEEYFDELVDRSFFQYYSGVNDGDKVYYKMHDLTHQFVEFLTFDYHYTCCFDHSVYNEPDVCPSSFHGLIDLCDNIRTIRSTSNGAPQSFGSLPSDLIHHLRCVRVMELEDMGITRLPAEIDQLIHLRYLNLSQNENLDELPDSFCNLINLQTLNLSFCASLEKLPKEIGRLINLRNLDIEATSLEYLPKGIQGWKSLQTLSSFIVSCANEGCSMDELSYLNHLQGCIKIDGLGRLKSATEAGGSELHKKNQLSQVWLEFDTGEEISSEDELQEPDQQNSEAQGSLMESVLEALQPHQNLEVLTITNYLGFSFPSSISNVKALRSLVISSCPNCTELPVIGQLPFLEALKISYLQNLEHIGVEIYGDNRCATAAVAFPKLTVLNIESNPNLKVWEIMNPQVHVTEIMPYVTSITLMENRNIIALPALGTLPSLEYLTVWNLHKLTSINPEFYGIGCDTLSRGGRASSLKLFPRLLHLEIGEMPELEVMDMGVILGGGIGKGTDISVMPCLQLLRIGCCPKLKTMTFLSTALSSILNLSLHDLPNLEEFKFLDKEEEDSTLSLLPCLFDLELLNCDNLKSFPRHLPSLSRLSIQSCSSIHDLHLYIPISPNLTKLSLHIQPHFSLENIAHFKELESLCFSGLVHESLRFIPETLKTLRKLQFLTFENEDMCTEVGDWSILSHIPYICIGGEMIDPYQ
ncbi:hypothetical protein MKW94_019634 [Papaver nudicaule]|uniref:Uncharacterized protein n=1 Tax=Papaver nudicaule TaxID=74823 RepID=A0AA41S6H5_PAPNU|nr:hypothetical protein [Papaver nudicaule]